MRMSISEFLRKKKGFYLSISLMVFLKEAFGMEILILKQNLTNMANYKASKEFSHLGLRKEKDVFF